jgi:hypothetical protein
MVSFTSEVNANISIERIDYYFIRINNITLIQQTKHYYGYTLPNDGCDKTIKNTELSERYNYFISNDSSFSDSKLINQIEDNKLEEITELFRIRDEHNDTLWFQFEPYSLKEYNKKTINLLFNDLTSLINNQEVINGDYYRNGDYEQYEEHMNKLVPLMLLIQSNIIQELLNEE